MNCENCGKVITNNQYFPYCGIECEADADKRKDRERDEP